MKDPVHIDEDPVHTDEDPQDMAQWWCSECGVYPLDASVVLDSTGAGDAHLAGICLGLLEGWPLRMVLSLASRVAWQKLHEEGARRGLPTLSKLQDFYLHSLDATWGREEEAHHSKEDPPHSKEETARSGRGGPPPGVGTEDEIRATFTRATRRRPPPCFPGPPPG